MLIGNGVKLLYVTYSLQIPLFADLNMPNEECDDYDPTIAVVAAIAAATLIVIAAVIACFVIRVMVMKRRNRKTQAETLHAHEREMEEKAENTADGEAKQVYLQIATKDADAARRRLETDEAEIQEEGAIDNPNYQSSFST